MNVLITGASGFLGRILVAEALRRGHKVRAMVRPSTSLEHVDWHDHGDVSVVFQDLQVQQGLADAVGGVEVVIHAAATKTGDFSSQFAGTVLTTENLLRAMEETDVKHIVCVSSFAVYDYLNKPSRTELNEDSALEAKPDIRYPYCETKLMQERIIADFAQERGWKWTILRVGALIGPDNLWTARLGFAGPKWWLRLGSSAEVPLTYVENCAEAIVLAMEKSEAHGKVFNVVDDHPPTQKQYMNKLHRAMNSKAWTFPVSWTLLRCTSRCMWTVNQAIFRGRMKMPNLLVPGNLHAAYKPLYYRNDRLKKTLDWECRYSLDEAIKRSLEQSRTS